MHAQTRTSARLTGRAVGLALILALAAFAPAPTAAYPRADDGYLDYAEMVTAIRAIEADHPGIVDLFSIGESHEGRELWAAKVSDNVRTDEAEPEVALDGGIHGREHLSTEMAVRLLRELAAGHGSNPRVTSLVDRHEIFIFFNLNPDGSEYDHVSGTYQMWRKNRQPTPGTSSIGTDINRNFGYRWGTSHLNVSPSLETYRGPAAWSAPEAMAFRGWVKSRVIDGEQQIRVHVTFHQHGRAVLYPYGYTTAAVPADMTADDHAVLEAMAVEMAGRSDYDHAQSSAFAGPHAGSQMDWMYGAYRIMTFTIEMGATFYMPDEAIASETGRNMDAAYYAIEQSACPYEVIDRAAHHCPPSWVSRMAGLDRYGTSAAISRQSFDPGVAVAYVATGAAFPDAMAGGVAAARNGGPMMLVRPSSVPATVARELDRLRPGRIVVLGGPSAVSEAVVRRLGSYTDGTVSRIAGADRYGTAAAISRSEFEADVPVAFVATGATFPDALSAVPAALKSGGPLLLVRRDSIPSTTAHELRRLDPGRIVIVGGPSVVSAAVADRLRSYSDGAVTRVAGPDRYDTSAEVARVYFGASGRSAYLATGTIFADALSGAPVAAIARAPVLLVRPTSLPSVIAARLEATQPATIVVLGGTSVVSREVAASAALSAR